MIRNIIFDIGQVLANFRWEQYIDELPLEQERKDKLVKATVEMSSHWGEHDRGVLSDEDYIQKSLEIVPGIEAELRMFFDRIGEIVEEYDYAEEFVLKLKEKGYKIYLLSNYGKTTFDYANKNFKFIQHVHGKIISSEVHYIKPEEEIYRLLIDTYGIKAEESIFLDDKLENIEAARNLGFHTILFENYEQGLKELEEHGVFI